MGKQQARRPGPHDTDLRPNVRCSHFAYFSSNRAITLVTHPTASGKARRQAMPSESVSGISGFQISWPAVLVVHDKKTNIRLNMAFTQTADGRLSYARIAGIRNWN